MKILCPYHKDSIPSMEVYETHAHCFSCGAHVRNEDIGVKSANVSKTPPEDLESVLAYISTLPLQRIRGLDLPADSKGFYIVWPDRTYYKRRNWIGKNRYTGPRGRQPPLFLCPGSSHAVVIEGELNAMTVHTYVNPEQTVCSPGAASEFPRHIDKLLTYDKISLVVDHDAAGVAYGLQTKDTLLKHKKNVNLITVTQDYNDMLQQSVSGLLAQFAKDVK